MARQCAKTDDEQMQAYTEAAKSGLYAKRSGLVGKYDNVRLFWEDEITRRFLRPALQKLLERIGGEMRRIRIMDLGCGSADGFELLSGVKRRDPNLEEVEVHMLHPKSLGLYKGVDLNEELLGQAAAIYGNNPKMIFQQADFTQGLPLENGERPYDLYFSSFGTFSHHNDDETAINLLAEIAERTRRYSLVVCDWLGRYSYEWQNLWTNDHKEIENMDYVVSYIYEKEERDQRRDELQHLLLRLMSREEAERIAAEAGKRAGVVISPLVYYDRSVFTGRHMDTGDYNSCAQPIRQAVNSLHETNVRTDLQALLIDYVPKAGFDFLNDYYEKLQICWNTLINYTDCLLTAFDEEERRYMEEPPAIPATYPMPLKDMMEKMRMVVKGVGWLRNGLPRENIIEPQLGYALRYIVTNLQDGRGGGHGLVGVFEIEKR